MADTTVKLEKGKHNPYLNALLEHAQALSDEKDAVMVQIDANRQNVRLTRDQGFLSAEQADAIETFYPTRERKPKGAKNGTATSAASN